MTFSSSFGRRLPSKGGGHRPKKKDPLGETVAPPIVNPAEQNKKRNPLGEVVCPSVVGRNNDRVLGIQGQVVPNDGGGGPPVDPSARSGIAVVGRFVPWPWRQHPDEAYLADALEGLGLRVFRVNQDLPRAPVAEAEWGLFTGNANSLMRFESWRRTHPTVVWTLDWLPDYPERRPIIEAGRKATLFLSSDQFDWTALGIRNHGYLPGACENKVAPFDPKPTIPCAFIGSLYSERRRKIASIVQKFGGVVLEDAGRWKYGEDLSKFLQTVKVLVGDNVRNDVQGYWSTRNYIVPGAGGFLLTSRVPGLELQFDLKREIAVYDSPGDLEAALPGWITSDAEREEIRKAGYRRARMEHTWEARAKSLIMHLAGRIHATP